MKQITYHLKTNIITITGSVILISAFLYLIISFTFFSDQNLIAHIIFNKTQTVFK